MAVDLTAPPGNSTGNPTQPEVVRLGLVGEIRERKEGRDTEEEGGFFGVLMLRRWGFVLPLLVIQCAESKGGKDTPPSSQNNQSQPIC